MTQCQRCFEDLPVTTMSFFNTQTICMGCKSKEEAHPDYKFAHEAETARTLSGDRNFPGIGLPFELRRDLIEAIMDRERYDGVVADAFWGSNEGWFGVEPECPQHPCQFCGEQAAFPMFRISNSEEIVDLCLRCGLELMNRHMTHLVEMINAFNRKLQTIIGVMKKS